MEEEDNVFSLWDPLDQHAQPQNLDDSEEEIEVDGYDSCTESGSDEKRDNLDEEIEEILQLVQYENILLPEVQEFEHFQDPASHYNQRVYPLDSVPLMLAQNGNTPLLSPLVFSQLFFTEYEFEILA
ncbi:hypothetical protein HOY82DRAFT_542730 [Tuber indicum]|nr:hypothetical protein HOY82DRAFT_542730 [Tuber indicum]